MSFYEQIENFTFLFFLIEHYNTILRLKWTGKQSCMALRGSDISVHWAVFALCT